MIITFNDAETFDFEGAPVKKLVGYDNGSFTIITEMQDKQKDLSNRVTSYAIDCRGKLCNVTSDLEQTLKVVALAKGYYCYFSDDSSFQQLGKIFGSDNSVVFDNICGITVYSNNWYRLFFADSSQLYDSKHRMMAKQFQRCQMLGKGYYALQRYCGLITEHNHSWYLFCNQERERRIDNVVDFVGSGCVLVPNDENKVKLLNLLGNQLYHAPIAKYEKLLDNRFVLTFEDGTKRLFYPDGTPQSVTVGEDMLLLADGSFITKDRNLITGLYQASGIVDKKREVPTRVQTFGHYYYLLEWFDKNALYDKKGKKLGTGYSVLAAKDNFLVAKRGDKVCIFNQFGWVAESD